MKINTNNLSKANLKKFYLSLKSRTLLAKEVVFSIYDLIDKNYYMIIEGEVDIYVPREIHFKMTTSELSKFYVKNKDFFIPGHKSYQSYPLLMSILEEKDEEKFQFVYLESDSKVSKFYQFTILRKFALLKAGDCFGELALISDKP
jgi:CRP-like cAMP-binding protein